jgi:hypothetical protein
MFWSVPEMMIISALSLFLIDISFMYREERRKKVILLLLSCRLAQERRHQPSLFSSWEKKNSVIPSAWLLAELLLNMDAVLI